MTPEAKQQLALERLAALIGRDDLDRHEKELIHSFDRQANQLDKTLTSRQRRAITIMWNKRNPE